MHEKEHSDREELRAEQKEEVPLPRPTPETPPPPQVPPSFIADFNDGGAYFFRVITTGNNAPSGYSASTEYWGSSSGTPSTSQNLAMLVSSYGPTAAQMNTLLANFAVTFNNSESATWTQGSYPTPGSGSVFYFYSAPDPDAPSTQTIGMILLFTSGALSSLVWYKQSASTSAPTYIWGTSVTPVPTKWTLLSSSSAGTPSTSTSLLPTPASGLVYWYS